MPDTLSAEDIAGAAVPIRTAQHWLKVWRENGWPRCYRVPRVDAEGRPLGGVRWVVDRGDYDDLINGRLRTAA